MSQKNIFYSIINFEKYLFVLSLIICIIEIIDVNYRYDLFTNKRKISTITCVLLF